MFKKVFKKKSKPSVQGDSFEQLLVHCHFIANNAKKIEIQFSRIVAKPVLRGTVYTARASSTFLDIGSGEIKYFAQNIQSVDMIHLIDIEMNNFEIYKSKFKNFSITGDEITILEKDRTCIIKIN